MKHLLYIFVGLAIFLNCKDKQDSNQVSIRLSNESNYNFKNIVVSSDTETVSFGNINSGEQSEYKKFEVAYRYAFVELEINEDVYTIQPIDYFGETPLEKGNYTYKIDANASNMRFEKLSLTLQKD